MGCADSRRQGAAPGADAGGLAGGRDFGLMQRQLAMFAPRRPLVERFGAEFFRNVPEAPGVYLMCGAGEGVLYVGKAKNLRRRLSSYRSADLDFTPRKMRQLLCAVERI